jgi:hypothetical protein
MLQGLAFDQTFYYLGTGWLRLMKSAFEQGKIKGIMGKQPGNRKIV